MWNRIILFRQSRIGDTLVTFPLIEALHKLYPDTQLIYCTQHFEADKHLQGHDVARMSPYVDKVVTYAFRDSILEKYFKLKKDLKVHKHDLLIYLPYSRVQRYQVIRDWLFFRALNFKNMVCFKETWDWTYVYERKDRELPMESDRMLDFVRSSGIPVEFSGTCSVDCDKQWAELKWNEWGLNGNKVLAICPGSRMSAKRWPIECYIELGQRWHALTGMALVIIGGPEETVMAKEIISHWPGYGFSACGADLRQTAAILSRVRAYCGNDTGAMHLAAILGIPCLAVFSSREPASLWHPIGKNHIVLREEVDCRHCNLEDCHTSPPLCLDKISVEMVLDGLGKVCRIQ